MKKDYFCPACKSLLNLQAGFSPKNPKHMCTECGRIVDVQSGKFPRDDEVEELDLGDFSIKEGKYDNSDNEKTAPIPPLPIEDNIPDEDVPPPPPPQEEPAPPADDDPQIPDEEDENSAEAIMVGLNGWKNAHKKVLMIAKLAFALIVLILIAAFLLAHFLSIGYDSEQLIGQDQRSVAEMLERQGFSRVRTLPVEELGVGEKDQENLVTRIEIGDKDSFTSRNHFLKWQKIKVYYKTLKRIPLPISSKDYKDMNYQELVSLLEESGFVNITAEPVDDLVTGWINSPDEVKDVFVERTEDKFSKGDKYRPDTEIIVYYHTFKEKK